MNEKNRRLDDALTAYDHALRTRPDYVEVHYRRALAFHKQGSLQDALAAYEQALRLKPEFAEAHNNRGNVLKDLGRLPEALAAYDHALRTRPDYAEIHYNRALTLHKQGSLQDALTAYEQALRIKPEFAEAHNNRGNVLKDLGRLPEALAAYDQALRKPQFAEAHYNRGRVLTRLGRLDDALAAYDQALRIRPDYLEVHCNRAMALQEQGSLKGALDAYDHVLRIKPDSAQIHFNRGNALNGLGRSREALAAYDQALRIKPDYAEAEAGRALILQQQGRFEEALAAYDHLLRIKPDLVQVHVNRGAALEGLGRSHEALAAYDRVLRIMPELAEAHLNRGKALGSLGRLGEALAAYDQARRIKPDLVEAHINRGSALSRLGRFREAKAAYQQALRIEPNHTEVHSNYLFCLEYDPSMDDASLFAAHREFGERHGNPPNAYTTHANPRDPEKTLRVGLVSPDLGMHPVGYMVAPLLASADPAEVQFVGYSNRFQDDALTERLKAMVVVWRSTVGVPDHALAELVRQDKIDILIDLAGHTASNRLPLFALKPAPVQVSWLGYRCTTGLMAIDYVLSDAVTVPPGTERWFVEQVIRLPESRLCYAPLAYAPPPSPPPLLERGWPTFGSFNNLIKITPDVLQLWARVLNAVPEARLLLKWGTFAEPQTQAQYYRLLADLGVEPARVELRGKSPHPKMLAEYADVDIALDPYPFSGGVSSLEALWQGVPVVTLPMTRQISRQTQAFLTVLGRTEWVAKDEDDYVRIVADLVRAPDRLASLRHEQRARMMESPLCDGPRFARHFERALRTMWRTWCSKATPGK